MRWLLAYRFSIQHRLCHMHGRNYQIYLILIIFILFHGSVLSGQPVFSEPQKLDNFINSPAEESFPLFFNKGLYFVRSFHPGNTGGINGGHDIWFSEKLDDNQWSKPHNRFPYFNTRDNNAIIGMSLDGKTIYMMNSYHLSGEKAIRVEASIKQGSDWSMPKRLVLRDIYPRGNFSGFYMHPSEKILLISMQGKNSLGGEDLYVCLLDNWGRWSDPIHLGTTINTRGFEISPFLSHDTKTLYFSSNGRHDSNNADIYSSQRLDNSWQKWSEPVRLPDGINSDAFDAYFFLSEDNEAYFVSTRNSEYSDIYYARLLDSPELLAETQGTEDQEVLENSDSHKERILYDVPVFESKGSAFIYFDFASAELTDQMKEVLKFIVLELKDKNEYRIELSGYADDLGPEGYNRILSKKRAESVKRFLVEEGLVSQKIIPVGKGMVLLETSEKTDIERQKNRRVELVILN
jgi:outer membrane protein OmpA-like peptidoglycan-associated protein